MTLAKQLDLELVDGKTRARYLRSASPVNDFCCQTACCTLGWCRRRFVCFCFIRRPLFLRGTVTRMPLHLALVSATCRLLPSDLAALCNVCCNVVCLLWLLHCVPCCVSRPFFFFVAALPQSFKLQRATCSPVV